MAGRCPAATPVGRVVVSGWRLEFKGCADVVPVKDAEVYGALWDITPACEAALDRFEGYPTMYGKKYLLYQHTDGKTYPMMMYVMTPGHDRLSPPSSYYHSTLKTGYAAFSLPKTQMDEAMCRALRAERKREAKEREMVRRYGKKNPGLMLPGLEPHTNGYMTGAMRPEHERDDAVWDSLTRDWTRW
jgi:gamma-glutamylcyclotransferase (GGCT)/AIG2-like uncharacterized protein YtfP